MANQETTPHGTETGGAFGFLRNGYDRAKTPDLTTSDIENATVYGRGDQTIGSVKSLMIGTDGNITSAVIDVGGFLGMGAHSVLLPFSQLTVLRETDGIEMRVYLDASKDQLKAMPHHVG